MFILPVLSLIDVWLKRLTILSVVLLSYVYLGYFLAQHLYEIGYGLLLAEAITKHISLGDPTMAIDCRVKDQYKHYLDPMIQCVDSCATFQLRFNFTMPHENISSHLDVIVPSMLSNCTTGDSDNFRTTLKHIKFTTVRYFRNMPGTTNCTDEHLWEFHQFDRGTHHTWYHLSFIDRPINVYQRGTLALNNFLNTSNNSANECAHGIINSVYVYQYDPLCLFETFLLGRPVAFHLFMIGCTLGVGLIGQLCIGKWLV
jgi:hypothetical protein